MNYAIAFAFAINISIIRSSCRVWRSYIVEITKIHHDITDCGTNMMVEGIIKGGMAHATDTALMETS